MGQLAHVLMYYEKKMKLNYFAFVFSCKVNYYRVSTQKRGSGKPEQKIFKETQLTSQNKASSLRPGELSQEW